MSWKKPIEMGTESLDALLTKAVRFNPAQAETLAREASGTFKVK
jgi:hypothetical protein